MHTREKYKNLKIIGEKFHKLTVISLHHKDNMGQSYWLCKCDCGQQSVVKGLRLYGQVRHTKSCGRCKTYKGVCGEYWCRLRNQARLRKIELSVDKKYVWDLLNKQDFKCAISGLPIILAKNSYEYKHYQWTASLDRINSSKGYIVGNVQWVHKEVNFMKHTLNQEKLLELCLIIAKRHYNI